MEEKKKRKGYSTPQQQAEANRRWRENNPDAKEKIKINSMRTNCKRYIREFSTLQELDELIQLIEKRREEL